MYIRDEGQETVKNHVRFPRLSKVRDGPFTEIYFNGKGVRGHMR